MGPTVIVSGDSWPTSLNCAKVTPVPINNLYRPGGDPALGFERSPLVLGDLESVPSRFRALAIQEWWNLVVPSGFLMLRLVASSRLLRSLSPPVERVAQLCRNGVLRFRKELYYGLGELVLLEKREKTELGASSQWTFGIVSNGKRREWLRDTITSIRRQGVPEYEILLIGPPNSLPAEEHDLRIIGFTEKDEKGWISRKKNLIAEAARYENLAIMHDRIVLDDLWYQGMQAYGNHFWLLGVPVESLTGQGRMADWLRYEGQRGMQRLAEIELLDYEDWDPAAFVGGGLLVVKRSCWRRVPLDEHLFWQQGEDIWLARGFVAEGWLPRVNGLAKAWSKTFYPTRVSLHLMSDGRRRRVAIPWREFSFTVGEVR